MRVFRQVLLLMGVVWMGACFGGGVTDVPVERPGCASIVIASDAPQVVQWAAHELQASFFKISGETFPVLTDADVIAGRRILIGQSTLTDRLGIAAAFDPDAFLIRTVGDDLVLIGDDQDKGAPSGELPFNVYTSRKGSLFAVYTLLEREYGVRWFWPGKSGEVIPKQASIELPASLDLQETPRFLWRHIFLYGTRDLDPRVRDLEIPLWYTRNRLGVAIGTPFSFGHSWASHLTNQYFEEHPEYYALIDGERMPFRVNAQGRLENMGRQVCTSNPEVVARFVENIRARFAPDANEIVSISPNDGLGFCECADCTALDHPELYGPEDGYGGVVLGDRVFTFVNAVAREIKKTHPNLKLGIFAYTVLRTAPRVLDSLEDNIVVSMTQINSNFTDPTYKALVRQQIAEWQALGARCVGRDYYSLHYGVSHPQFQILDEDIKFMARNNFFGFYWEGTTDFAANHLNFYLLAKLLWNPELSTEAVLDDYYHSAYGPVADTVRAYFELMEASFVSREPKDGIYMGNTPQWYSSETLDRAAALLAAAVESAGDDDGRRQRIAFLRFGHRYTEMAIRFTRLCQKIGNNGLPIRMKQYTPQPAAEPASPEQMRAWVGEAKEAGEAFYALVDEYKHTASLSADDVMLFNERTYRTLATVRDYYELYVGRNQTVIDLPDTWKFKIDPEDQGQAAGWAATDCSDADWDAIRVDAFWEAQGYGEQDGYPGLPSEKGTKYAGYNGIAWYRLSDVRLPEDTTSETLVSLRLGAVDEDAWVYVNGQLCGTVLYDPVNEPDGWKLPRLVPIGGAILRNAANTIAVRVRDTIGGGGIWQGTALVLETPDAQGEEQRKIVFLEDFEDETLHIETHSNSVAQVVESDGQKVLRVVVKNPYPDQAFSKSWIIPVDSDREYVASFRYRSANVVENREFKQRWRRTPVVPQVRMFSTDILGKVCQPVSDYVWFGGEFQENVEDWTLVRRVFRTPEAAASLRLTLFLYPKGEYFIDNVCVETF